MAWEARSGLKLFPDRVFKISLRVGMAWEARSGFKPRSHDTSQPCRSRRNGLGSPFGFETRNSWLDVSWSRAGRNGLGSPFGFETPKPSVQTRVLAWVGMAWEA